MMNYVHMFFSPSAWLGGTPVRVLGPLAALKENVWIDLIFDLII